MTMVWLAAPPMPLTLIESLKKRKETGTKARPSKITIKSNIHNAESEGVRGRERERERERVSESERERERERERGWWCALLVPADGERGE